jgi:hypothetical protein
MKRQTHKHKKYHDQRSWGKGGICIIQVCGVEMAFNQSVSDFFSTDSQQYQSDNPGQQSRTGTVFSKPEKKIYA